MNLLDRLIKDEKKNNKSLYSSGSYWDYKNKKTFKEIKKNGIQNFRGLTAGIGTSFADNIVLDIRNELNTKGKIVSKIFSLPFIKRIFNSQLNITKNHIDDYIKNISIVYKNNKNVQNLANKFKFENTTEFGCLSKFELNQKEYSIHYLNMADRINKLSENFDFRKIESFFEIGGGFGANIHFLLTNFPNIKKVVYLDIVPNIFVGTEYLKFHFGKIVKDYNYFINQENITFEDNDKTEIICIPPWEIEKLEVNIDHFHNAASFVEMPDHVIKNYVKFIKKFKTKEISLISYGGYDKMTTFNSENLNSYFENKLIKSWKNFVIDEYDKKLIYLTSK